MSKTFVSIIYFVAVAFIALASRWLPHPPNFTAISGFFIAGVLASRQRWLGVAAFLPLIISDLFLGGYPGLMFVYVGHAAVLLFGLYFATAFGENSKRRQVLPFAVLNLSSALIFFALSNLGVWWSSGIYPRTLVGLVECFVMALPFFHQTAISQLIFSAIFVGSFYWIESRAAVVETSRI